MSDYSRKSNRMHGITARSLICKALVFVLCASSVFSYPMTASAATSAKAKSMRLEQTEGDVGVTNVTKGDLTYTAGMRLGSGDDVDTDTASYAWISLDDSKAVKVDEVSEVEVRQKGKNLEALLISGNLYFNVTVPLKSDESMNIRTSTMATGIRGTCGWVSIVDGCNTRVHLLEGVLQCKVINPVDGIIKTVTIHAGETADFTVYGVEVHSNMPAKSTETDVTGQPYKSETDGSSEKNNTSGAASGADSSDSADKPAGTASETDSTADSADNTASAVTDDTSAAGSSDQQGGSDSSTSGGSASTGSSDSGESAPGSSSSSGSAPSSETKSKAPVSPDGESCDIVMDKFGREDIPAFVLAELVGDEPLIEKIYDQSGIDLRDLTQEEVDKKLKETQAETAAKMQEIREAEAAQANNISKDPVWEHGNKTAKTPVTPEEKPESASTPSERVLPTETPVQDKPETQKAATPKTDTPATPPAETPANTTPAQTESASAPAPGSSGTSTPTNNTNNSTPSTPSNPSSSTLELTMPQTATDVQGYLNQSGISKVILKPGSGNNTLDVDIDFTVPANKNLTANIGVPVVVDSNKTATINGTADLGSSLTNGGTVNVNSSHTLKVAGQFTNTGSFNNNSTGRSEFDGGVSNTGSFTTSGTLDLNSAMTSSGTLTVSGGTMTGSITGNGIVNVSAGSFTGSISGSPAVTVSGGTIDGSVSSSNSVKITGGTISSTGTAVSVTGGGSFEMTGGLITSSAPAQGTVAVDVEYAGTVTLDNGEIKNTSTGGAIKPPSGYDFNASMGNNMVIDSHDDNLLGYGSIDGDKGSLGLVSVWTKLSPDEEGDFYGKKYSNSVALLRLNINEIALSKVNITTITSVTKLMDPAVNVYVEKGITIPFNVSAKDGWEITSVTITYDDNGGTQQSIPYTHGTSTGFTMPNVDYSLIVTVDINATQRTYPVTLNPNADGANVTIANSVTSYTYETGATLPVAADVTRESSASYDYAFAGWFTEAVGGTQVTAISASDFGNKTFYAHWTETPRQFTVALDPHGGVITGPVTGYTYGTAVSLPTVVTKASTSTTDYAFDGWYTDATGGTKVTSIPAGTTGNLTYHAHWTESARKYGVTIAPTTGGSAVATLAGSVVNEVPNGSTVIVKLTPNTGYELDTVTYTPAGGTATALTATANANEYSFTMPDKAVTVNAAFKPCTYPVTLITNGGTINSNNVTQYTYGTAVSLPTAADITKGIDTFAGWYTTSNPGAGDSPVTTIPSGSTGPKTYYAKWIAGAYSITNPTTFTGGRIDLNANAAVPGDTVTVTVTPDNGYDLTSLAYTKGGVSTPITATNGIYSFVMPDGVITINAVFTKVRFFVTVPNNIDHGTVSADATGVISGTTITVTATPDAGYELKSLSYTPDGGSATAIDITSTPYTFNISNKDVTLAATFGLINYATNEGVPTSITGGGLTTSPANATMGTEVTVTLAPATGYQPKSLVIRNSAGTAIDYTPAFSPTNLAYKFTMPAGNVTYEAEFEKIPRTVTISGNPSNGSITIYPAIATAGIDDTVTVRAVPDTGYRLKTLTFTAAGSNTATALSTTNTANLYLFTMPNAAVTISGEFEKIPHDVTVSSSVLNGTISLDPVITTAGIDDTVTVRVAPSAGYRLKTLTYTPAGSSAATALTATATADLYSFAMPNAAVTINGEFELIPYTTNEGVPASITGGGITTSPANATMGTEVTVTLVPATGYQPKTLTIKDSTGTAIAYTPAFSANNLTYKFIMPAGNVTYEVEFEKIPHDVSAPGAVTGGTITTPGVTTAGIDDTVTVSVQPDTGYRLKSLSYNDGDDHVIDITTAPYTFTMPNAVVTISGEFEKIPHTITISGNPANGSITMNPARATAGIDDTVTVSAVPAAGYKVKTLNYTPAGGSATALTATATADLYSFTMPNAAVTISGEFELETYTTNSGIPASITGGSLSTSPANAKMGDTVTLTLTPDTGYRPKSLTIKENINNQAVNYSPEFSSSVTQYTFVMPAGNVTYEVEYEKIPHTITISGNPANGSITMANASAGYGDTVTVSAVPAAGYQVKTLTYTPAGSSTPTALTATNTTNQYSFTMPNADVTISGEFEAVTTGTPHELSLGYLDYYYFDFYGDEKNSTLWDPSQYLKLYDSASQEITSGEDVSSGEHVTLSIQMSDFESWMSDGYSYYVDSLHIVYATGPNPGDYADLNTVAGAVTNSGNNYTFTMPDADTSIYLTLKPIRICPVNVTYVSPYGSIDNVDGIVLSYSVNNGAPASAFPFYGTSGDNIKLSITYDHAEYSITGITATYGGSPATPKSPGKPSHPLTVASDGSFTMPNDHVDITVRFTGTAYPVTMDTSLYGSISGHPVTSNYIANVSGGDTVEITSTPVSGFILEKIIVYGEQSHTNLYTIDAVNGSASFTMPSEPVCIIPEFAISGTNVTVSMNMPLSVTEINTLLCKAGLSKLVINKEDGYLSSLIELSSSDSLAVPAGKTLEFGEDITLCIAEGAGFTNNGTVIIDSGAEIDSCARITNDGTIINNGTFNNYYAPYSTVYFGRVTNNGTFTNNGTYTDSISGNTNSGTFINNGTVSGTNASQVVYVTPSSILAGGDTSGYALDYNGNLTITDDSGINAWASWIADNTEYRGDVRNITISSGVTSIPEKAFRDTCITSVSIPEGVTSIGKNAFYNCASLADVSLPDTLITIDDYAFQSCASIESIDIPASVTTINKYAFSGCSSLLSIDIPNGVSTLGEYAFYNCDDLESASIPGTVQTIGKDAFLTCHSLSTVTIEEGVKVIDEWAFFDCPSLTSIDLPDSTTSIRSSAFSGCNLTTITIPKNVYYVASSFVAGNRGLTAINVDSDNDAYESMDGVLFTKNGAELTAYPIAKPDTTYTVPSTVTTIKYESFAYTKYLREVTIPASVTTIEDNSFDSCQALAKVTINANTTAIESQTFRWCYALKEVTIPSTVRTIKSAAFMDTALTDVYFGGSEQQWNNISVGGNNEPLTSATKHFASGSYSIAISNILNGSVEITSPDDITSIEVGTEVTMTVTPATGYELESLTVKRSTGQDVSGITLDSENTYKFRMPSANILISAYFIQEGSAVTLGTGSDIDTELPAALASDTIYLIKLGADYTLSTDITIPSYKELQIERGVTLTVPSGKSMTIEEDAYVYNDGTIDVESDATLTINGNLMNFSNHTINNYGSIVVGTNGELINGDDDRNPGIINNYSNATITNNGYIGNNSDSLIDNEENASIINSGMLWNGYEIDNDGAITNSGTVVNEGGIDNDGTITNSGTVVNEGEIDNDGTITNNGTITNSGSIYSYDGAYEGASPEGTGRFLAPEDYNPGSSNTGGSVVIPGMGSGDDGADTDTSNDPNAVADPADPNVSADPADTGSNPSSPECIVPAGYDDGSGENSNGAGAQSNPESGDPEPSNDGGEG